MPDRTAPQGREYCDVTEPFSGSDFAGLQDVDGLGVLADAPGAAAKLAQDLPALETGVGALARGAQPGTGPLLAGFPIISSIAVPPGISADGYESVGTLAR
jgi:hypothetical protein